MRFQPLLTVAIPCFTMFLGAVRCAAAQPDDNGVSIRVAVFETREIPTRELLTADSPRLKRIAEVIQRLRPNVVLLSGVAYDTPGGADVKAGDPPGQNGHRFIERYLSVPLAEGISPLRYAAFMAPVNSGMASGLDLDHSGRIVTTYPTPGSASPTAAGEAAAYSGDCWGPGSFPGQYGMALLVDERLAILADKVRTFRRLPWDYMPGAMLPPPAAGDTTRSCWYTEPERSLVRLSSVGHWDVPIWLPNGAVVHFLCSRPIAPTNDLSPHFASRRNHDEIRFWADYIEDTGYIADDANAPGGLEAGAPFVILGSFGLAPRSEPGPDDVIGTILFGARRVNHAITPKADLVVPDLDPTATGFAKVRADYVLPSTDLGIAAAGVWRHPPDGSDRSFPSDHFPVWMELIVPAPVAAPAAPRPTTGAKP